MHTLRARHPGMVCLLALAVSLAAGTLACGDRMQEIADDAHQRAMESELRRLDTVQELYRSDDVNFMYMPPGTATHGSPHAGFEPIEGITVVIERPEAGAWAAVATHEALPGRRCGIFVGAEPPADNPAEVEGRPRCD